MSNVTPTELEICLQCGVRPVSQPGSDLCATCLDQIADFGECVSESAGPGVTDDRPASPQQPGDDASKSNGQRPAGAPNPLDNGHRHDTKGHAPIKPTSREQG